MSFPDLLNKNNTTHSINDDAILCLQYAFISDGILTSDTLENNRPLFPKKSIGLSGPIMFNFEKEQLWMDHVR
jgi:hypothetical protein